MMVRSFNSFMFFLWTNLKFLIIYDSFSLFFSDTFKQFLAEEFDDRVYANNIIQGRAISETLARLADGINLLDKELHGQVCSDDEFHF